MKKKSSRYSFINSDKQRICALFLILTCTTSLFAEKSNNTTKHSLNSSELAIEQSVQKKVSGIVKDATGEPIIGANVVVKGTTNGTITDIDGNFSIEVPEGATLLITYIGYNPQEVRVGASNTLDITLQEDSQTLDEVVVVGFGSQKKANLTGAVSSVKMDEIIGDRPIISAADALQGNVPGLLVSSGGNQAGVGKSFQIRTFSNFTPPGVG